ncbi:NAD-dependent epimerase/dehydratase family protein [Cumulibacter manganitolerans]|uniref:NAD-dependent epimerase/dehydratase family protein n=1 Tax=Cumulibacter manganitolerans TaxID=1884992 RepID=UPI0012977EA6|nr:NAD-dependent epimerase/dehydratase family protein [Cumulibacter manganitolerans]
MRVAVVGASGNVGTAVLRALAASEQVDGVVAIARRIPDVTAEPYRSATWHSIDIATAESARTLEEAFAGVDAVIHLAWLIQPNRQRELLRRANVDGTARVATAAAAAGVRTLVVASSVGSYSPARDCLPHDEGWPTEGIASSDYSVDKAAQERFLDKFEADHPGIAVSRMRTALVFQADAGAEIQRLFLGRLLPSRLLRRFTLPGIPLPQGIRLQVVHAEDAAQAYLLAALTGPRGAFNIAADQVLAAEDLAAALRARRPWPVRPAIARAAMSLAYRAHVIPAGPGWLDMGMQVPVMDCARAKATLRWNPRRTARQALDDLVGGMRAHRGTASPALRPEDTSMPTTRPDPNRQPHS